MKIAYFILALILFGQIQAYSQFLYKTGWQEEGLKSNPSQIATTTYDIIEKFGEFTERQVDVRQVKFTEKGLYLVRNYTRQYSKMTSPPSHPDTIYYYGNSGNLIRIDVGPSTPESNSFGSSYFEKQSDHIIPKDIKSYINGDFEYDSNGNVIIQIYENPNDVYRIIMYEYIGRRLSEYKLYSGDGTLFERKKWIYDERGNLVTLNYYRGRNDTKDITESKRYSYDLHNNIIKKTELQISNHSESEIAEQLKSYYWYSYEYNLNGTVKKSIEYLHFKDGRDDLRNYWMINSYDKQGNWTEKVFYNFNRDYGKFMPSMKYVREIEYY